MVSDIKYLERVGDYSKPVLQLSPPPFICSDDNCPSATPRQVCSLGPLPIEQRINSSLIFGHFGAPPINGGCKLQSDDPGSSPWHSSILPLLAPAIHRNLRTQQTFGGNLQLQSVLVSLAANSSLTGYYTATTGKSPDQIYGWVQCRGDIDGEVCQICAADATSQIVKFCPNRKAALSSFHLCIMYYYGNNFSIPNWIKTFAIPSAGAIPNPPTIQAAAIVFLSEARRFGHRQSFGPVLLGRQVQVRCSSESHYSAMLISPKALAASVPLHASFHMVQVQG
ncbi:Cysteine-rich repeat secretory protein 9 [Nymphaea thermarum]|nr:Cysteine-rich repeat secretory protein 9 [Nymphaea thermarum]